MTILRRIWYFVTRWRRIGELEDEMRLHVELRAAANRRAGLETGEAARAARLRFGNLLKLREEARDAWGLAEFERIGWDLRHSLRRIINRPARTLVVVLTLALGIAATTSMFTFADAMLLKPPAWNGSDRLVWIANLKGHSGGTRNVSYRDYLAYRKHATRFSDVAAYGGTAMSIGGRQPQRVLGGLVSGNYFDVLGLRAQIGRTFTPGEDRAPNAHPVVVLSDALWKEQFGADPRAVDTIVTINGHPFTVIGVAPPGFTGVAYADDPEQLWVPMAMQRVTMPASPTLLDDADAGWLRVVGRLQEDASVAQADAEMRVIARQLNSPHTSADQQKSARVLSLRGGLTPWEQDFLAPMIGLISMVPVLVLLVACANVANVLIAHHVGRRRELAMRRAIGASRGRLIRQLLAESLMMSALAGLAGFAISFGLSALVMHYGEVPADVSRLLVPDGRTFLAAMTIALLTIVGFSLVPALMATQFEVLPVLKDEGTTSSASHGSRRLRRIFVVAQVALSLALLITAGLFFQSLSRAMRVNPGFEPRGLAMVSFDLNLQGYASDRRAAFVSRFVERASALPAVISAATADILPFGGEMYGATVVSDGGTTAPQTTLAHVSPAYFQTLDLPLVMGRDFTRPDIAANAPVAIVNETLARRLWPGTDPIGKRLRVDDPKEATREVIGVARDAKYLHLTESERGACYVPMRPPLATSLVVRTAGNPRFVLSALRKIARNLDPDLPLFKAETMQDRIRRSVNLRRAGVSLLGVLGGLTLLLASVGIYGVAAHSVSMRTRELGIRMSLGARARDVVLMVVRENVSLTGIGVAIGLGLGTAGWLSLASLLFGVTPADAGTFAAGAAILCLVSVVASYVPARRAARLNPLLALRHD
jgi:predicted permease